MTPELKTACETVFQEHKASGYPINWKRDIFRGRISIGLIEMTKETLIRKNIIYLPNPAKKTITVLNPAVAAAATFEEAEEMIRNKVSSLVVNMVDDQPAYVARQVSGFVSRPAKYAHRLLTIAGKSETATDEKKWYMKPLFYYVIWPVCAAVAGGLIAWLIGLVFTELFF
jgi:hypothetical protein